VVVIGVVVIFSKTQVAVGLHFKLIFTIPHCSHFTTTVDITAGKYEETDEEESQCYSEDTPTL
jgi:hypothetical protein